MNSKKLTKYLQMSIYRFTFAVEKETNSITAMKTTIDKSQLMKRAWEIYRREKNAPRLGWGRGHGAFEFRTALRMAWKEAKRRAAVRATSTGGHTRQTFTPNPAFAAGCLDYYASGSNGRTYFGD